MYFFFFFFLVKVELEWHFIGPWQIAPSVISSPMQELNVVPLKASGGLLCL